jgi:signal peptidase II
VDSKAFIFVPIAVAVAALDQLGKWYATTTVPIGGRAPLIGDWLSLVHEPAVGGAFGLFRDWPAGAQWVVFALLSLAAAVVVVSFYRDLAPGEHGSAAALAAILGGVASNTVDRLRLGAGIDFLHVGGLSSDRLPDFNLADMAIVLGVVTLIVELLATEMATRAAERPRR